MKWTKKMKGAGKKAAVTVTALGMVLTAFPPIPAKAAEDFAGQLTSVESVKKGDADNIVIVTFNGGVKAKLTFLEDGIFRYNVDPSGEFSEYAKPRQSSHKGRIQQYPDSSSEYSKPEAKIKDADGKFTITSKNVSVEFDKETDGTMITTHGGGTSRKRMHAAKDYSGSEIMRTIRDEVLNLGIPVVEFTSAVELLKDEKGQVAGAVLQNMETGDYMVARAKTVVIATGGAGRMHYQGFPTSNHYGATADGLVLGYRAGAALLYQDSIQYHPTGAVYPSQILGALVTEKVRSVGAQLVNAEGEAYIHPLETRDVNASGVIRECREGRGVEVPGGLKGVWLDTPMIEILGGEGTIEKRIPAMFRMYMNYGIDMRKVPIVIYPTLHYQNGGLEINGDGFTKEIPNLLVAGEAAGGIHGTNRLMGNSLLDVIVFGRNAGKKAAAKCKDVELGKLNLDHIYHYEDELEQADIHTGKMSPMLLPNYARHEQR